MTRNEPIRDLESGNQRLERAAASRWSGFEDEDLRTLTACLQAAADHVGEFHAATSERFVREIAKEVGSRSPA